MESISNKFENFFDRAIRPETGPLERKRILLLPFSLFWRIGFSAFFILIMSVFTGVVIHLDPGKETILHIIRGAFAFILIAIILVVSGFVMKYLVKKYPDRWNSPSQFWGMRACIVFFLLCLPFLGSLWLTRDIHSMKDISFGSVFEIIALVIFVGFPVLMYSMKRENLFSTEYKEKVITEIVKFASPESSYKAAGYISQDEFDQARIYAITASNYSVTFKGSDLIRLQKGGKCLQFSYLDIARSSIRGSGGFESSRSSSNATRTIFMGVFITLTGIDEADGETMITCNTRGQRLSNKVKSAIQLFIHSDSKPVMSGDETFDSRFLIHTTREDGLGKVLTPKRRELILKAGDLLGPNMKISIRYSRMSIAVLGAADELRPSIFRSLYNIPRAEKQFEYIKQISALSEF
ncbi:MAG: DUF3137 domain-containing protein [Bacteroidia bacterium]